MQKSTKKEPAHTLTLSDNTTGKSFELPVINGTLGPSVIDVRRLYAETGMFTYDPGFTSTGSAESAITYIDGENGVLLHRGYAIEDLAKHSNFLEVCYLLLYGKLPNVEENKKFTHNVTYHSMLNEQVTYFLRGFRRDAHPMAIMLGVVGALSAFYHDNIDINDPRQRDITEHRLLAKMPTIAAMAYKYSLGQPVIYPKNDLECAFNTNVTSMSYPFGESRDCFNAQELFKKTNTYQLAFTVEHKFNTRNTSPLEIGRYMVNSKDSANKLNKMICPHQTSLEMF